VEEVLANVFFESDFKVIGALLKDVSPVSR